MDIKALYKDPVTSELAARYDEACKRLLANKEILAQILKACVEEYKDCSVYDIADKYIEGTPETSKEDVHLDGGSLNIMGLNSENSSIGEGTIRFDVVFSAIVPDTNDKIGLIINIEAQNKYNTGYPLIKRGIYYCSRLISSQYNRYFEKSHYEDIKKVYSIWICINVPMDKKNTVTRYRITEENVIGEAKERRVNYDLLNVVMVCLGDERDKNYRGILKFLDLLLKNTNNKNRKETLVNEFGIRMAGNLEGEVNSMCNLSAGVLERGFEQGIEKGIEQGIEKGIEKGAEATKEKMIVNACKAGMSMENIKAFSGLSEEEIRSILKERGYNI